MVAAIHHEEKIFIRGERQTKRILELTGLIALETDSALPLALYLRGVMAKKWFVCCFFKNKYC
jgi:hypothetical protein